ncbi:reverse transcriptase [Tanacetum coccineum]
MYCIWLLQKHTVLSTLSKYYVPECICQLKLHIAFYHTVSSEASSDRSGSRERFVDAIFGVVVALRLHCDDVHFQNSMLILLEVQSSQPALDIIEAPLADESDYIHNLHEKLLHVYSDWRLVDILRQKADLAAYLGLLQPLPVPEKIWSEISMDFIVGLPKSQGKTVIFLVVDRLVYRLHGLPNVIVSDRDSVFLSLFWQSLFKIFKVELKMSSAYHPQTDGAVETMDRSLQARESAIEMVKFHITRAQDRMKKKAMQNKLSAKYYGPFLIIAKLCKGNDLKMGILPHCGADGLLAVEPEAILDRRMGKLNNRVAVYVLVKWVNHLKEDATWELYEYLVQRFLEFSIDP